MSLTLKMMLTQISAFAIWLPDDFIHGQGRTTYKQPQHTISALCLRYCFVHCALLAINILQAQVKKERCSSNHSVAKQLFFVLLFLLICFFFTNNDLLFLRLMIQAKKLAHCCLDVRPALESFECRVSCHKAKRSLEADR